MLKREIIAQFSADISENIREVLWSYKDCCKVVSSGLQEGVNLRLFIREKLEIQIGYPDKSGSKHTFE